MDLNVCNKGWYVHFQVFQKKASMLHDMVTQNLLIFTQNARQKAEFKYINTFPFDTCCNVMLLRMLLLFLYS